MIVVLNIKSAEMCHGCMEKYHRSSLGGKDLLFPTGLVWAPSISCPLSKSAVTKAKIALTSCPAASLSTEANLCHLSARSQVKNTSAVPDLHYLMCLFSRLQLALLWLPRRNERHYHDLIHVQYSAQTRYGIIKTRKLSIWLHLRFKMLRKDLIHLQ